MDGYRGIEKRLDRLEVKSAKRHKQLHDFMMDGVKTVLDMMDKRFTGVDKRFTDMDKRFTSIDAQLAGMTSKIDNLAERLDVHEQSHLS
jgi:archaellum component FlaC